MSILIVLAFAVMRNLGLAADNGRTWNNLECRTNTGGIGMVQRRSMVASATTGQLANSQESNATQHHMALYGSVRKYQLKHERASQPYFVSGAPLAVHPVVPSADRLNLAVVEVVVSHYNEDLSWLNSYQSARVRFTIYSKSQNPPEKSIALPNLGREGHTFLHHIVEHYGDLAPWNVFTQATRPAWGYHGPGEQSGHLSDNVLFDDYLVPFPGQRDSFFVFDCVSSYPSGLALMRMGFLLKDLSQEALSKKLCPARGRKGWSPWWFDDAHKARLVAQTGMAKWYHEFIAQDANEGQSLTLAFAQSGRFAVSRERIQLRPRTFYVSLLQQLSQDLNPIEGYWLELAWYDVFHPDLLQSKVAACEFPSQPNDVAWALPVANLTVAVRELARQDGLL